MTPARARCIWQALQNLQQPGRTIEARIKDVLDRIQAVEDKKPAWGTVIESQGLEYHGK